MFEQGLLNGLASFLSWLGISIVKFVITPSLMTAKGYQPWEILIVTFSASIIGVLVFYHTGKAIFSWFSVLKSRIGFFSGSKRKPVVTPGRRRIIKFKKKFGFTGLLIVSGLISIPIAALLGAKYFSNKNKTVLYLIFAFIAWACVLTLLSQCVKNSLVKDFI
jgi:hypothetical protein